MHTFSIVGILALLAGALVLAAFVSGLVLLILGIARKRRGLWIGGLITLLVSGAVLASVAAAVLLFAA